MDFDFIVIGAGSAGYAGAAQAQKLGLRVAVIEGGEEVGGLCILRGCMPSKTLLESGHRAHEIRRAGEFGLQADFRGADAFAIRERKRRLVADFAGYRRGQLETGSWTFIRGNARFIDAHTVEVVEVASPGAPARRITGHAFLLSTGSDTGVVDFPGLKATGFLTSDEVLDSASIPESVAILGGGATAVEFASYYAGLGTRVTIVQRGAHLLREMDTDVSMALSAAFNRRGIEVCMNTVLKRFERVGSRKRIYFQHSGADRMVEAEEIIYALGRVPRSAVLSLDKAGVDLNSDQSVHVIATQQTSVPHIFAAGDLCGPFEVVHSAIQQGEIAARNAALLMRENGSAAGSHSPEMEAMDYSAKLFCVFSHPEVASVGATARELAATGRAFIEASYPFDDHGKSIVKGETEGFVKLIVEPQTRKLLGGAVIGPEASELIHEITVALALGATAGQLARIPHYHPTLSEIWTYPAEALAEE